MSTEGNYAWLLPPPIDSDDEEEIDIVSTELESSSSSVTSGRDLRINPYHALVLASKSMPVPEIEQCRIRNCSFAPPEHRIHPIINDTMNEEHRERLISDEEESDNDIQIVPGHSNTADTVNQICARSANYSEVRPVMSLNYVETYSGVEEGWWQNLKKLYPPEEQCRIPNCPAAPPGHMRHPMVQRNYSIFESRLMIQYLYHHSAIHRGKGLLVWQEMHDRGYMRHRTAQSLNNNFKKHLLKDIELFKLPPDVEGDFMDLLLK